MHAFAMPYTDPGLGSYPESLAPPPPADHHSQELVAGWKSTKTMVRIDIPGVSHFVLTSNVKTGGALSTTS